MEEQEKKRNPELQELIDTGEALKQAINVFLSNWPSRDPARPWFPDQTDQSYPGEVRKLQTSVRQWFNIIGQKVLPVIVFGRDRFLTLLDQVLDGIEQYEQKQVSVETAQESVSSSIDSVIDLIRSVPDTSPSTTTTTSPTQPQLTIQPNTAFILMWMDPTKPDLVDVSNTFKEVCGQFGIRATRADDVEHQDRITDVILQHIQQSEFLIADLTGERPNVYYEVGYAHAIGKRPILFRKKGTHLHFDLSVHNVPEYENITELKKLLRKRLEAMTGKDLNQEKE